MDSLHDCLGRFIFMGTETYNHAYELLTSYLQLGDARRLLTEYCERTGIETSQFGQGHLRGFVTTFSATDPAIGALQPTRYMRMKKDLKKLAEEGITRPRKNRK